MMGCVLDGHTWRVIYSKYNHNGHAKRGVVRFNNLLLVLFLLIFVDYQLTKLI